MKVNPQGNNRCRSFRPSIRARRPNDHRHCGRALVEIPRFPRSATCGLFHVARVRSTRILRQVRILDYLKGCANAMIHQDFTLSGTGPMVEIFDDRLEISNPGLPLIDTLRFIDHSPRSRNEALADLMRRLGICEERGSGFDKVIHEMEQFHFPAPDIRTDTTHTRVVLFGQRELTKMERKDKVRACYQHRCLLHLSNQVMTNATLRERFRITEDDYTVTSRIIRETVKEGLIKLAEAAGKSRKHARYVPFWA